MPPLATQAERETKKRAEEALMEYSKVGLDESGDQQMSLSTDSPIGLSILKPGWIYGGDRISSSVIGLLCHFLFDWDCKKQAGIGHEFDNQPPRNVSSISVQTLAMAAICQALDPGLS